MKSPGLLLRFVVSAFALAMLSVVLLHGGELPLYHGFLSKSGARGLVQVEATLWWLAVSLLCSTSVRLAFTGLVRLVPGRRRAAYAFFADAFALMFFVVAAIAIAAFVFELPVSAVFATSSILGVVLGFALQNTLGDVLSGIALAVEQPFRIGDWITVDDKLRGRVVAITWRSTRLQPKSGDMIVLPNGFVSRARIVNHYLPDLFHRESVDITIPASEAPARVCEVLVAAALASDGVVTLPKAPGVDIVEFGANTLTYRLNYTLEDFDKRGDVQSAVFKQVWSHLGWAGIDRPLERSVVALERHRAAPDSQTRLTVMLARIPVFAELTESERERLCRSIVPRALAAGEVLLRQFDDGRSLYVVHRGLLDVSVKTEDGERVVGRLGPGDYLGEASLLTGSSRNATVTAVTPSECFELDKDHLAPILEERPEIVETFARVLAQREKTHHFATANAAADNGLASFTRQISAFLKRL